MAARETRDTWAKRVARWRDSGLSAKDFAGEIGVNAHTLTYWAWKLNPAHGARPSGRVRRTEATPAKWLEIVERRGDRKDPAQVVGVVWFELVLSSGRTVRVPPDFDSEALGRLLTVVDAR